MSLLPKYVSFLPVCLLASCMVGPDFHKPANDLPVTWQTSAPSHRDDKDLRSWWRIFEDPQLNRFVGAALDHNPDMKSALLSIREARERLRISEASLLPSADANAGWSLDPKNGFRSSTNQAFSLSSAISWEVDLFGGNRRSVEASRAALMSTEASACAVRTALVADVAEMYFTWISLSEQLRIAKEHLEIQKSTLDIAEKRYKNELASRLDVEQARSSVASTESRIPDLSAQAANAKNSLAVLLGTYQVRLSISMPKKEVFDKTPTIPVGLPSDLLRRRPDIIAAEANLHEAVAQIGVAVADLYPRFSLTGSVNSRSRDFGQLFRENNNVWSLGGNLAQPLFNGGALRANVRAQEVNAEQKAEDYRKALITAVSEVESALIEYGNYTSQMPSLMKQNEANKEAFLLSRELYSNGLTEFLNVITAQGSWLSSEESLVTARQNIRKAVVRLALALGGGW